MSKNMKKEKRYYIAYGSNLSVEQMAHRCPGAKIAGMAYLRGLEAGLQVSRYHRTLRRQSGSCADLGNRRAG